METTTVKLDGVQITLPTKHFNDFKEKGKFGLELLKNRAVLLVEQRGVAKEHTIEAVKVFLSSIVKPYESWEIQLP